MRVKLPVPVYGAVPPLAVTVIVVDPPKQAIEPDDAAGVSCEGCVTVILVVAVQPFASDTVKV